MCLENLKLFPYERKYYNREELAMHKRNGDKSGELNITQNSVLIDDTTADTMYLISVCALLEANKSPCSTIKSSKL